jgi:hypothetical protein
LPTVEFSLFLPIQKPLDERVLSLGWRMIGTFHVFALSEVRTVVS